VGALYVRKRPRVRLEPIINGGGQERGIRSGTVPSPLAVGLGAACSICKQEMDVRISVLRSCEHSYGPLGFIKGREFLD
jgi:cysteine sulfinate desulfinase/cysteine desulfurase-like protein